MPLHLTDADVTLEVDSYQFLQVSNVTSYAFCQSTMNTWIVHTDASSATTSSVPVYLIIDHYSSDAFAHWVYESAIYLPAYPTLKAMYPSLKLVLSAKKDFKRLFCNYLKVPESDIVYTIPEGPNHCLFPSPISNLSYKEPPSVLRDVYYERFFKLFEDCPVVPKEPVDYLIMPRQSKENYTGNERSDPFEAIYNYFKLHPSKSHRILHTDTITDLIDQINELRSAKVIICHDGSALTVNGMFVRNKIILPVYIITPYQASVYPSVGTLLMSIAERNSNDLHYLATDRSVVKYIREHPIRVIPSVL
jgi:hypothetical protein